MTTEMQTDVPGSEMYELAFAIVRDALSIPRKRIEQAAVDRFGADMLAHMPEDQRAKLMNDLEFGVSTFAGSLTRQLDRAQTAMSPVVDLLRKVGL
jgi:hypothetical protein